MTSKISSQNFDKPLFPEIIWSRPENKRYAGKLLVIGGHEQAFSQVASVYAFANKAGAGHVRVLLPDRLKKLILPVLPEAEFAPSTPSGSFAKNGLGQWIDISSWADGVLICDDVGNNSETATLIEAFTEKYTGHLTVFGNITKLLDTTLLSRPSTTLIIELNQLQKLATKAKFDKAFTSDLDTIRLVSLLEEFTPNIKTAILTSHNNQLFVGLAGRVSVTSGQLTNLNEVGAHATVWWIQQPSKQFEALTTGILLK